MALWLCEGCGTLYAVGLFRCPRCHETDFHEFGTRPEDEEHPMAKITNHGGPTNEFPDEPAVAEPHVVEAEVAAPEVPDGNIDTVLAWVEDGLEDDTTEVRARAALDAELAKGDKARSTLVARLEDELAPDDEPEDGAEGGDDEESSPEDD